jgi:L-ascorbate metabolism protein UlaG (beta-lactamase superfamily)
VRTAKAEAAREAGRHAHVLDRLTWLGHDAFLFEGPPVLYVDPICVPPGPKADLVLVTHGHFDHCSPSDIAEISTPDTVLVCPRDCCVSCRDLVGDVRIAEPGARISVLGLEVEAIPAYTRRRRLHSRANGWLGYLITRKRERWYHAGDTDYITEMQDVKADIACLPVSGGTVMNPIEAAAAADCIGAGVSLPMHYGTFVGDLEHAERFRDRANSTVLIPAPLERAI